MSIFQEWATLVKESNENIDVDESGPVMTM